MGESSLVVAVLMVRTPRGYPTRIGVGWWAGQADRWPGLTVDVIDLDDVRMAEVVTADHESEMRRVQSLWARLKRADAFVVVTPPYDHCLAGSLKAVIDWCLEDGPIKPVVFMPEHRLHVALRTVEELRAATGNRQ